MRYRKPDILMLLSLLVGIGALVTTMVQAASPDADDASPQGAVESTSFCVGTTKISYPCALMLPLSYRGNEGYMGQPSDAGYATGGRDVESGHTMFSPFWRYNPRDPSWRMDRSFGGMDMKLNMDRFGPKMNLDFGALELDMTVNEGDNRSVEARFFLGIKSPW